MAEKPKRPGEAPAFLRKLRDLGLRHRTLVREFKGREDKAGAEKLAAALDESKALGPELPVPPPPRIDFRVPQPPIPDFNQWIPQAPWPPHKPIGQPRWGTLPICDYQEHRTVDPDHEWGELAAPTGYLGFRAPKSATFIVGSYYMDVAFDWGYAWGGYVTLIDIPAMPAETRVAVTSRLNVGFQYLLVSNMPNEPSHRGSYLVDAYLDVSDGTTRSHDGASVLRGQAPDSGLGISFPGPTIGRELEASVVVSAGAPIQLSVTEWVNIELTGLTLLMAGTTWDPLDVWLSRGCRRVQFTPIVF